MLCGKNLVSLVISLKPPSHMIHWIYSVGFGAVISMQTVVGFGGTTPKILGLETVYYLFLINCVIMTLSKHYKRVAEGLWGWLSTVGVWVSHACSLGLILDWFPSKKWEDTPVHGLRCVWSEDEACWTNAIFCTSSCISNQGSLMMFYQIHLINLTRHHLFAIVVGGFQNKAICRVLSVLSKQFWTELFMASSYLISTMSNTNIMAVFIRQRSKSKSSHMTGCRYEGRKNRSVWTRARASHVVPPLPIDSIDPDEGVWRLGGT